MLTKKFAELNNWFPSFYRQQGGRHTWDIFKDKILSPGLFTDALMANLKAGSMSVGAVINHFGYEIFDHGVLVAKDVKELFLKEIQDMTLSQIVSLYGLKVLDYKLAAPSDLKAMAIKECSSMTFKDIINKFGVTIFDKQILSQSDTIVQQKVQHLCQNTPFFDLIDQFGKILIDYNLLPATADIKGLVARKDQAESMRLQKLKDADDEFVRNKSAADNARKKAIASAEKALQDAENAHDKVVTVYKAFLIKINDEIAEKKKIIENYVGKIKYIADVQVEKSKASAKMADLGLKFQKDKSALEGEISKLDKQISDFGNSNSHVIPGTHSNTSQTHIIPGVRQNNASDVKSVLAEKRDQLATRLTREEASYKHELIKLQSQKDSFERLQKAQVNLVQQLDDAKRNFVSLESAKYGLSQKQTEQIDELKLLCQKQAGILKDVQKEQNEIYDKTEKKLIDELDLAKQQIQSQFKIAKKGINDDFLTCITEA